MALLAALRASGINVSSAKVGPDYIDPRFHSKATGRPCYNLDQWAMRDDTIMANLDSDSDLVIIEGVMGLFDGPETGKGSTADLAEKLDIPVILIVDCSHQAQSIAALVHGFRTFRPDLNLAGVILNHTSSQRHTRLMTQALASNGVKILGAIPKLHDLKLPSRHLGLVQASEHPEIDEFIHKAGMIAAENIDLAAFQSLAMKLPVSLDPASTSSLPPLGQNIAIASDEAFGFIYPHLLTSWQSAGAQIQLFSPLANHSPPSDADAIFLPGGYPELHAAKLAANNQFLDGLRNSKALIYGECGGYMVLGQAIIDKQGQTHQMAGLLPVTTSFAKPKLTLGYRSLSHSSPLPYPARLCAHEFHFSTIDTHGSADPLFSASDTIGTAIGDMGMRRGRIMGSYAHIIDAVSP